MTGITQPICGPICGPVVGAITERVAGSVLSAFSAAKYAIAQDAADVNILVIGDSTGNDTTDWVYLFGQWLATQYPSHSVSYRLWDDTNNVYATAVSLGAGTGSNTIRIWNACIAGTRPTYLMGAKFAAAMGALTPDAVIFNHGKNISLFQVKPVIEGGFVGPVEQVMQANPGVPVVMLKQSPNRDDNAMAMVIDAQADYQAARKDLLIADVYSLFMSQGKVASLYSDNLHPSAAGTQLYLSAVKSVWLRALSLSGFEPAASVFDTMSTNILTNGDFSSFSGSIPDSWTVISAVTASKDTVNVDGADPYSLKLANSGAVNGRIGQSLTFAQRQELAGKIISLAARVRSPAGSGTPNGFASILVGSPTLGNVLYDCLTDVGGKDGFRWCAITNIPVPADVNVIQVRLSADQSAVDGAYANWSRAILIEGPLPSDMS